MTAIHSILPSTGPIRRIVLTGFMGSGKTTVGPLVAARLGWRFVDVDDVIEAEAGCTIAELFTRDGEPAFRDREHATIVRLASQDDLVLALGGGAIERAETRDLLLSTPTRFSFTLKSSSPPRLSAAAEPSTLARSSPTRPTSSPATSAVFPSTVPPTFPSLSTH